MKKRIESLDAWYYSVEGERLLLGRLGVSGNGRIVLEVGDADLLRELSPFTMDRLNGRVVYPSFDDRQRDTFQGLFGLFADSLPDAFGMKVVQGKLGDRGYASGPLEVLAYLGEWGRGAISYEPSLGSAGEGKRVEIGELFDQTLRVQEGETVDLSDPMAKAMGTAGGTRPKAFVVMKGDGSLRTLRGMTTRLKAGESCQMVKFDCTGYFGGRIDHETRIEAAYLDAASEAGIDVPEFLGIVIGDRYHLATRRFDRTETGGPVHVHSLWGLLEVPTETPRASYDNLARAAVRLAGDLSLSAQVFRRLAFNVLTANMDDHPKQHSFLYDGEKWTLAPAYDLTFSERSIGHSMAVLGSVNPGRKTLLDFAGEHDVRDASEILEEVMEAVWSLPAKLAGQYEVPGKTRRLVEQRIERAISEFSSRRSVRPC